MLPKKTVIFFYLIQLVLMEWQLLIFMFPIYQKKSFNNMQTIYRELSVLFGYRESFENVYANRRLKQKSCM